MRRRTRAPARSSWTRMPRPSSMGRKGGGAGSALGKPSGRIPGQGGPGPGREDPQLDKLEGPYSLCRWRLGGSNRTYLTDRARTLLCPMTPGPRAGPGPSLSRFPGPHCRASTVSSPRAFYFPNLGRFPDNLTSTCIQK